MPVAWTRRQFMWRATAMLGTLALGCVPSRIWPTYGPTATPALVVPTITPALTPTLAPLPLRQRAAQMLVVGFRGRQLEPDDPILRAIGDEGLGGVILFTRNIEDPAQLAELTATLRAAAAGRPLIIAVDQEGGAVARLNPRNGFPATPAAAQVGRGGDVGQAIEVGRSTAATLAEAGINLNLAPVVDLNLNVNNPSIGALGRSYSANADVVVEMAGAFVDGHRERGVLTTLKHFPGLGSATGDTDREFVDISATWSAAELDTFQRMIGAGKADLVMVGNALNGQIDGTHPASLSAATLRALRDDMGWDGVVITDDLMAGALANSYPRDEVVRLAIGAGSDLLLLANSARNPPDVVTGTLDAIERMIGEGALDVALIDAASSRVMRLLTRP